jgi:hypothetical protein
MYFQAPVLLNRGQCVNPLYFNPKFPFPYTQKRPRMPAHELAVALPRRRVVRVFLISFFLVYSSKEIFLCIF